MDSIGNEAFVWCTNLTEVEMPQTLKYLGYNAFTNCTGLTSIAIPQGLTWTAYTPEGVLTRCGNLKEVSLPEDMTAVPKGFFNYCQYLTSVTLPDSVKAIGYQAFLGCLRLKSINFPKKIKEIGNMAFQDCASLRSFAANDSLQKINYWAFKDCYSLRSINISAAVNDIDNQAFAGCDSVTELKVNEANHTYTAKENMLLSKDEKTLFFRLNNGAKILTLPDGLETIGENAVEDENIKVVVMPASIKEVKENALYNNPLLAIHFKGTTPPTIANDMFSGALDGATAFVPRNTAKAYQAVSNLNRFKIEEENALPFIYTDVHPVNKKYVQALDTITVDFEEQAVLENTNPVISILEDSVAMNYQGSWTAELANNAKRLVLVYRNSKGTADKLPLSSKKEYLINIPATVVRNASGLGNGAIEINVYGPDSLQVTSTSPAEGEQLKSIKEVDVTFESEVEWVSPYGNNYFKLYKNGAECELPDDIILYPAKNGSNGIKYYIFNTSYMLDSISLDEGAQYKLVIPAGLVYKVSNPDSRNDEIVINFTGIQATGINGVSAAQQNASENVYTLSGIRVKDNIKNLPTGIYIIKGKKVMVRKE